MRLPVAALLLLALLLPLGTAAQTSAPPSLPKAPFVARIAFRGPSRLAELNAELDVWEVHPDRGYLLAAITPRQAVDLQARGYALQADTAKTALLNHPPEEIPYQTSGIPGYPCYRTVEETYADLSALAAAHPDLAQWLDIGNSWEKTQPGGSAGYDIHALVLTNQNIPGPKPRFFLMAAIHARELTTAETATRFAEYLVNNYGSDPQATWLLDFTEIHIVPQANPDGRKMAEAGEYWRKNTDNDDGCTSYPDYGTDLNRNSSYMWGGSGASTDPCNNTYRGPSAASEPEVQAIQTYVASIFPDQRGSGVNDPAPPDTTGTFITLHSYSELVLWPWGFDYPEAPNHIQLQTLGRKFAYFNGYAPSQSSDLYPAAGTTDDWAYGDLGIAAYTFEIGTSFFQSCSYFENTVYPENLPALLYAASTSRRPYQTPAGPDTLNLTVTPTTTLPSAPITITAQADDTRYGTLGGVEPSQNISAARFSIDTPSWVSGTLTYPLQAADSTWDTPTEGLIGHFAPSGLHLSPGRHTLFVEAQDSQGNWGAPAAVFFWIPEYEVNPLRAAGYGMPGTTVTYTLALTNNAALSDTYTLSLSGNQWSATAPPAVGPLDPEESATFTVTVAIPAGAAYGETDTLQMAVVPQSNPAHETLVTLQTSIPDYRPEITLRSAAQLWGQPGETLTYTLRVRNRGNLTATYTLSATGTTWNLGLPADSGALPPHHTHTFPVSITIPAGALPGAQETFTVTAAAQANPLQTDSIALQAGVPRYGLQASLQPQAASAPSGTALTYTLRLTNTGNLTDSFSLDAEGLPWPLEAPSLPSLPAGGTHSSPLSVTVPATATAGTGYTFTLRLHSQSDPAQALTLTARAETAPLYGVEIALLPPAEPFYPGAFLSATLRLTNTGNLTDTFDLSADSAWPIGLPAAWVSLGAWETRDLPFSVRVPADIADGERVAITITATSRGEPSQHATARYNAVGAWRSIYLPLLRR